MIGFIVNLQVCLREIGICHTSMLFPVFPWSCSLSSSFQPEYRAIHFFSIISLSPRFPGEAKLSILKDQFGYCKQKLSTSNHLLCGFLANQWARIHFGLRFEVEPSFCFKFIKRTVPLSRSTARKRTCTGWLPLAFIHAIPVRSAFLVSSNRVMLGGNSKTLSPVLVRTQYRW